MNDTQQQVDWQAFSGLAPDWHKTLDSNSTPTSPGQNPMNGVRAVSPGIVAMLTQPIFPYAGDGSFDGLPFVGHVAGAGVTSVPFTPMLVESLAPGTNWTAAPGGLPAGPSVPFLPTPFYQPLFSAPPNFVNPTPFPYQRPQQQAPIGQPFGTTSAFPSVPPLHSRLPANSRGGINGTGSYTTDPSTDHSKLPFSPAIAPSSGFLAMATEGTVESEDEMTMLARHFALMTPPSEPRTAQTPTPDVYAAPTPATYASAVTGNPTTGQPIAPKPTEAQLAPSGSSKVSPQRRAPFQPAGSAHANSRSPTRPVALNGKRRLDFDSLATQVSGTATWPGSHYPPGTAPPSFAEILAATEDDIDAPFNDVSFAASTSAPYGSLGANALRDPRLATGISPPRTGPPKGPSTGHQTSYAHSSNSSSHSQEASLLNGRSGSKPGVKFAPVPQHGPPHAGPTPSTMSGPLMVGYHSNHGRSQSANVPRLPSTLAAYQNAAGPSPTSPTTPTSITPRQRHQLRAFMKDLHIKTKDGYGAAKNFIGDTLASLSATAPTAPNAAPALGSLPADHRSQICVELADVAKRDSEFAAARQFYKLAINLCPVESKPWFEYAKMEEENGNLQAAAAILEEGMKHCDDISGDKNGAESLLFRALRICSRTGEVDRARKLLGRVLNIINAHREQQLALQQQQGTLGIPGSQLMDVDGEEAMEEDDDYAKPDGHGHSHPTHRRSPSDESDDSTNLDGEGRNGNNNLPWRIILEGATLEWKFGKRSLAHQILDYLQREMPYRTQPYLCASDLMKKEGRILDAYQRVILGLQFLPYAGQLYFEALNLQQLLLRLANSDNLDEAYQVRQAFMAPQEYFNNYLPKFVDRAVKNLSPELVWKLYCEVAYLFDRARDITNARKALVNSERHAPQNLYWKIWLHGAKVELSCGDPNIARKLLVRAMLLVPKKMQAIVLLDISRCEEILGTGKKARYIIQKAKHDTELEWKVLLEAVLLEMRAGDIPAAIKEARSALKTHPSTGRLWAVLIQLEHLRAQNMPPDSEEAIAAHRVFEEALHEVPKSGEVWCEGARLAMHRGDLARARQFLDFSLHFTPQYGDSLIEYLRLALLEGEPQADLNKLWQVCASAEPDYGPVWAFCKQSTLDAGLTNLFVNAREILLALRAKDPTMDLASYQATLRFSSLPLQDKIRIAFG